MERLDPFLVKLFISLIIDIDMKQRVAKKIMKNVRLYPGMHWVYGSGRIEKANSICIRCYARVNENIKKWNILCEKDPLSALKVLQQNQK